MLDRTYLMYLSREIGSSKHVQVPKGFLAVCMGCGEGELKLDLSKIVVVTICGIDSIPANTGERIIHPHEAAGAFALLVIYAGMLKIVIWIRGFLGETQCWRKEFVNFSSIVIHFDSLTAVQKVFLWGGKQ